MAAASTQTENPVSLKLVVNEETDKVLFAEATKDFVDVLCSILTLPLGTIARLVQKDSNIGPTTLGCLNALYQSVENPHTEFLSTVTCKEMLLKPSKSCYCSTLKLNIDDIEPTKYFRCVNLCSCLSTFSAASCGCGAGLSLPVFLNDFRKGFVNDVVTYIISDNLVVMPISMDTSLGFLQSFRVERTSSMKEIIVNVTKEKVLDLLKCSLLSKTTLTDLFLRKKPLLEMSNFSPCHVENSSSFQITVKLAIRKLDGKIMYAQGEKDFADLLLCFLSFPLGGVVHMLGGNCSVGCIDGLYRSIADLNETYFVSKVVKDKLIDPRLSPYLQIRKKILPIHEPNDSGYYFHYLNSLRGSDFSDQFFIADYRDDRCQSFTMIPIHEPNDSGIESKSNCEGFVKGQAVYMATDDLVVTPMSPISAMHLLGDLKINLSEMEEKVVTIGIKECLSILKASLSSTSALTNGLSHLLTEVKKEK